MKKICSLYKPEVRCIAKRKEAKKYKFYSKVSIAKTMKSGIIVGVVSFSDNPYDANTLDPLPQQIERLTGMLPKTGIANRGYRRKKKVLGVESVYLTRFLQRLPFTRSRKQSTQVLQSQSRY